MAKVKILLVSVMKEKIFFLRTLIFFSKHMPSPNQSGGEVKIISKLPL